MREHNRPMWKTSCGSISAAAWANQIKTADGNVVPKTSVTIERRYKDADGRWQSTTSMSLADLLKLQVVTRHAIDRLLEEERGGEGR